MGIIFRPIERGEENAASKIERECLDTAWSADQIACLPESAVYIVAVCGENVCGIASMYCIVGEGQIMNVAVSEEYRLKGIASGLMQALIDHAKKQNCENITLEVAENNISAISLYEKYGFNIVGTRKGFYGDVNALLMEKIL